MVSTHLFSIDTEKVRREADFDDECIKIPGERISYLMYANDIAHSEDYYTSMFNVLNKVNVAGENLA